MKNEMLKRKQQRLQDILRALPSAAAAFSGGVDSTYLLYEAKKALGDNVIAITAVSPLHPESEIESAAAMAKSIGVEMVRLDIDELKNPSVASNPPDRCYHCKKMRFEKIIEYAESRGTTHVLDGTNADDTGDFRPGLKAKEELGVISPLLSAEMTKADVRKLSKEAGLPSWNKAARSCLGTRFPTGTRLTYGNLALVEEAETFLEKYGFSQLRLRVHESIARIEIPPDDFAIVIDNSAEIVDRLRSIGFRYVTLDLSGYTSGSMNRK